MQISKKTDTLFSYYSVILLILYVTMILGTIEVVQYNEQLSHVCTLNAKALINFIMVIRVVEFSSGVYKIFWLKVNGSQMKLSNFDS